jgi:predicted TPR repeat methyltransferase
MLGEYMQELLGQKLEDVEEPTRELTVDEAVAIAISLQRDGRLAEAAAIYGQVLQAAPDHAEALHYAGVLAHQEGRSDDGIVLVERSLALAPDRADWFGNLGIIFQERGRFDDAITAYRRAIALDPRHANTYSNLGVLLRATGKPAEAEEAYRTAISLDPDHIDAYTNLGILLNGLKRTQESVACFCKVITLRPKHPEARKLLALAHCTLGEIDKAVQIFEEWLEQDPNDATARHMLAACTGQNVPDRASDGYVATTFDSFAASFESKLARLSYRAPALVGAMLDDTGLKASKALDVLDMGCGTGLCGALVAPYARRLTGVDLSAGMLAQAREKQLYDELVQGELTAYLRDHPGSFDVIISADTLVYFGALDDVLGAAARALNARGFLIFTLEHAVGESVRDFRLQTHGRYTHGRRYVERLLSDNGIEHEIAEAELRMESGAPVAGLVVRGRKRLALVED